MTSHSALWSFTAAQFCLITFLIKRIAFSSEDFVVQCRCTLLQIVQGCLSVLVASFIGAFGALSGTGLLIGNDVPVDGDPRT